MADTVITNTPGTRSVDDSGNATAWVVGLIIILALLIGGYALYRNGGRFAPAGGGTNIQVTVPSGSNGSGGGTAVPAGTGTGGTTQ
jgi:hypothetical protein